jgi:hypothetical protein
MPQYNPPVSPRHNSHHYHVEHRHTPRQPQQHRPQTDMLLLLVRSRLPPHHTEACHHPETLRPRLRSTHLRPRHTLRRQLSKRLRQLHLHRLGDRRRDRLGLDHHQVAPLRVDHPGQIPVPARLRRQLLHLQQLSTVSCPLTKDIFLLLITISPWRSITHPRWLSTHL